MTGSRLQRALVRSREAVSSLASTVGVALAWAREPGASRQPVATVALNLRPIRGPWGGGNQWAAQLTEALRSWGYAVRFRLEGPVDCIIMADPRPIATVTFGLDDIRAYLKAHPDVACVHRINECDVRKGTGDVDRLLASANEVAHYTVFISTWLRDYHAERWFDRSKPHTVITNGADPRIYHPVGSAEFVSGGTMRIVTHHWSDNQMKGFAVYREVDRLIAEGQLGETELWIIGRWPREIRWRAAVTFGPKRGARLGNLLRSCHVYLTGSLWEPGGMHFIEGLQCGLPLLYHLDGGGIVELGRMYGVGFRDDIRSAVRMMRERYAELRKAVLQDPPSGERMCIAYIGAIERTIELRRSCG